MNSSTQIQNINVDLIIPNRFQPRLTFDEAALNDLASSIKEHGIIQPLVLRKLNDKYEIIAGERRYKAAVLAGLTEVPAIIANIDDNKSAEVALVENVQRKNLNSMEEAKSYKKILDKGYLTQEALAQKMGISQSTLANKLRLLNLTPEVQNALINNRISERHARSLLLVADPLRQINLLNTVISQRLTVRQLDELIKNDNDFAGNNADVIIPVVDPVPQENFVDNSVTEPSQDIKIEDAIVNYEPLVNSFAQKNDINIFDYEETNFVTNDASVKQEPINQEENIFDLGLTNTESASKLTNNGGSNLLDNNFVEPIMDSVQEVVSPIQEIQPETIESIDSLDISSSEGSDNNNILTTETNSKSSLLDLFKMPTYSSLEDEVTNLNTDTDDYFNPFNNLESEEAPEEVYEIVDEQPIIETENKKEEPVVVVPVKIVKKGDLSSVKEAYENLKNEIEEAGFKISTEDFDFEDIYQIIIKIDKQD